MKRFDNTSLWLFVLLGLTNAGLMWVLNAWRDNLQDSKIALFANIMAPIGVIWGLFCLVVLMNRKFTKNHPLNDFDDSRTVNRNKRLNDIISLNHTHAELVDPEDVVYTHEALTKILKSLGYDIKQLNDETS